MVDVSEYPQVRILLVDDDRAFREMIASALEATGYRAVAVASGSEALAAAEAEGFDLLISDVVMPGMGGFELAERLCGRWPWLPVLFISGYREEELCDGGALPARTALLRKPFDLDELAECVRAALTGAPGDSAMREDARV